MSSADALRELARLHGVETEYHDVAGAVREASAEALEAVLAAMDALEDGDAAEALAARRRDLAEQLVEPAAVAWGGTAQVPLRVDRGEVEAHLVLEDGSERAWGVAAGDLAPAPPGPEGTPRRALPLSGLPPGHHRLIVRTGACAAETAVVAAPERAWQGDGARIWGVFLPLYALQTRASWGAGDLSDLRALADWSAGLGGGVVGTLPLLAAFLDQPFEPSPYAPASRLFWNELYLDPRALPELEHAPGVRRLLASVELEAQVEAARASELVDYDRVITLKRRVLEDLAQSFFARPSERREAFESFVSERPELELWAAFRAVGDRRGEPWQSWPERLREGHLAPADYDPEDFRYHLWAQWAADGQLRELADEARRRGPGLYLDLPVGVHASAYDVWRERAIFARGVSAGAPPDAFFTKGQDWGFPPLKPEALREQGYDYLVACLGHHLEHAGILRLDHVMQLYRLFWIPEGLEAKDGVYVRYPAEELFAVLSLESHRHRALVVGENLGTVPREVDAALERHGVLGMHVLQYELAPGAEGLAHRPSAADAASLNTHDMPPFKAFWDGADIEDRLELGLLDEEQARRERERLEEVRRELVELVRRRAGTNGQPDYPQVLRGLLEYLAESPARLLLINLEDLWQETRPQNVPGTSAERPNWRRKARLAFEQLACDPEVLATLRRVDALRRQATERG
ncbi:MAG TPA: 4-alpha-glucanotransferase [Thermoanaerobaculia bacterium]|nr:4-alpha-glucanotransferase [Thermoanaerobaculia bacterium]